MSYINRMFSWDFNALKRFYEKYVKSPLDRKVDKEAGKGLSANDYTTAEKQKLAGIQNGAEANVQADWSQADPTSEAYIRNKPNIPDASVFYTKTEVDGALGGKVDKVEGKGLSTNDYDNTEKQKLADVFSAVGSGGDIDTRINNAVAAETQRAQNVESSQQSRITSLESAVGTGGSVDSRIADAVSAERQRATGVEATKADKSDTYTKSETAALIPDVSDLVADAEYDSVGKEINFFSKNGEVVATIDATGFIKDGMVDTVTISGGNLVITFNTDAGKEDITLLLENIFDPSNYYTKSEIDSAMVNKTNNSDFTAHTGNTTVHVTAAERTAWNNKSDFSGSYNDLTDKPTIPTVPTNVSAFNNDAGYLTSHQSLTQYYTKLETDNLLNSKADASRLGGLSLVALTQAQYDALTTKDANTLYIITE